MMFVVFLHLFSNRPAIPSQSKPLPRKRICACRYQYPQRACQFHQKKRTASEPINPAEPVMTATLILTLKKFFAGAQFELHDVKALLRV